MCEGDLQILENNIRSAIVCILRGEENNAVSHLLDCLRKFDEYL